MRPDGQALLIFCGATPRWTHIVESQGVDRAAFREGSKGEIRLGGRIVRWGPGPDAYKWMSVFVLIRLKPTKGGRQTPKKRTALFDVRVYWVCLKISRWVAHASHTQIPLR